jgi:poly(3-hydroxybutyrate) depolymerase
MTEPTLTSDTAAFYRRGSVPFTASRYDQRLHYGLYIPRDATDAELEERLPLLVAQHGTGRTAAQYRERLRGFADERRIAVLTPLFPAGLAGPDDLHSFKFLDWNGLRFDLALLDMIDEISERYGIAGDRFHLHGFSGGGQFAHRFFYLHANRLAGISIGAPGRVTELDDTKPWWIGTDGMAEIFGRGPDLAAMRDVPVQLVVGSEDTETWEINNPGEENWMDGVQHQGSTRIERLRTLERSFAAHGIACRFDLVPGAGHRGSQVLGAVTGFVGELLERR